MSRYHKKEVGERIRARRKSLGMSQEDLAERIRRVPKFCADIERGQAGMSIETLLEISAVLKISPGDILLGGEPTDAAEELEWIISALRKCTKQQQKDSYELLKLFLRSIQ